MLKLGEANQRRNRWACSSTALGKRTFHAPRTAILSGRPTAFDNFVTADGSAGPTGEGGFAGRSWPLSSLCFARLPVGASHADFPQAEEARKRRSRSPSPRRSTARPAGNSAPKRAARATTSTAKRRSPKSISSPIRIIPAASRFRCLWDKKRRTIVNNEFVRNHPHAQFRLRRVHRCAHRLLSRGIARRNRPHQRPRLPRPSTTASIAPALPPARRPMKKPRARVFATFDQLEERLSRQRYLVGQPDHRSGLAAVHHADPFRYGLLQPLQMQSAARRRLSEPVELSARSLCQCRASPRPSASITSSGTITAASASESDRYRADRPADRFHRAARPRALRLI